MKIELGTLSDIQTIMTTIEDCVTDLHNKQIYQWNQNYPTREILIDDINNEDLYIIKTNSRCVALIVINENQENEWKSVRWSELAIKPLIIHRLIVHPEFQRQGIGRTLIKHAINYANENKYDSIRFDVYGGNPELIKTYENMGCIKRGEVYFPYRELPFYCYEMYL